MTILDVEVEILSLFSAATWQNGEARVEFVMPKPLVLTLATIALLAALAAGSAYAFTGTDRDDQRATHARPGLQEPVDAQELDDDGPGGGTDKAALIAAEFGVSPPDVTALRDQGIGWGAMFKLYALARAKGVSVNDLVAATVDADGEKDFAFGEIKKSLTPEQLAALDDGPKNFGQLVSKSKKSAHAGPP